MEQFRGLKLSEANLLPRDDFYRKDAKIAKGLEIMSESSPPTSLSGQNGLNYVWKKPRIERITRMNQSEIPDKRFVGFGLFVVRSFLVSFASLR